MNDAISIYTNEVQARSWLQRYQGKKPLFVCVLGFTETGLIEGISAAGATPKDRALTAIADAEFLVNGVQPAPKFPLPPLHQGASPVFISRAVLQALEIPIVVFDAGLARSPSIEVIQLGGSPARCISTGRALDRAIVDHLFEQGLKWGEKLAQTAPYLILSECVVGGTTTAQAILTGLGIDAAGKVNSSHPICNHAQKSQLVQRGLAAQVDRDPTSLVAAVGDPMQIVVAGMTISASRSGGVLLAGGTQMLAVYALAQAIAQAKSLTWLPQQVIVGTTRWVAEDASGDTIGLATAISSPLLATRLSFSQSSWTQLQAYEQGFVKEGVGAGGCAIAATMFQNWGQAELLSAIEQLLTEQMVTIHPS